MTLTARRCDPPAKNRPGSAMTCRPVQSENREAREELIASEMDCRRRRGGEGSVPGQEGNPPPMSSSVNLQEQNNGYMYPRGSKIYIHDFVARK